MLQLVDQHATRSTLELLCRAWASRSSQQGGHQHW
jgi:hypothetical protein